MIWMYQAQTCLLENSWACVGWAGGGSVLQSVGEFYGCECNCMCHRPPEWGKIPTPLPPPRLTLLPRSYITSVGQCSRGNEMTWNAYESNCLGCFVFFYFMLTALVEVGLGWDLLSILKLAWSGSINVSDTKTLGVSRSYSFHCSSLPVTAIKEFQSKSSNEINGLEHLNRTTTISTFLSQYILPTLHEWSSVVSFSVDSH